MVSKRPPLAPIVLLGGLLLYFWRFGYDYGTSDQDEIIPPLLHRLNSSLFQQDWFIQSQAAQFSVRDYTIDLLYGLSQIMPPWWAVVAIYVIAWFVIAYSIYRLTLDFTDDQLAASAAVVGALVLTPDWTLGGNDLVVRMFTPSMLGWALALPAVHFFLRRRWLLAGVFLGLAAWFQALVGLQCAVVLGGILLLEAAASRNTTLGRGTARPASTREHPPASLRSASPFEGGLRGMFVKAQQILKQQLPNRTRLHQSTWLKQLHPVLSFGGAFTLAALPVLAPVAWQQLGAQVMPPPDIPSFFYILAVFRNPHHYLPSAFPLRSYLHFGLLAAAGAGALLYLNRRRHLRHGSFILRLMGCIGILLILGAVFTEIIPVLFITKLQLFKLTVLAKVVFVIGIAGAGAFLLPDAIHRLVIKNGTFRWAMLLIVAGLWGATILAITANNPVSDRLMRAQARQQTPLGQVEQWARFHTPKNAVFAIPPSISSFRSNARRAIVVNFKAVPYQPSKTIQWYRRLTTIAPVAVGTTGGAAILDPLDTAYHRHNAQEWRRLAKQYGIDFVLIDATRQTESLPFSPAFSFNQWTVYRLSNL